MQVPVKDIRPRNLFWAKTGSGGPFSFKSVAHHCADVAAAAYRLQELNPARTAREARLTGLAEPAHIASCALFAGLHDIGKFSRSFQFKAPGDWPDGVLGPLPTHLPATLSHWEATALLLRTPEVISALSSVAGEGGLDPLVAAAIAGHHGRAPADALVNADPWEAARHCEIGPACVAAAATFAGELIALLAKDLEPFEVADRAGFSFALNGLITLADWIGSDAGWFGFEDPALPLAEYWPLALERAGNAIRDKGLLPARPVPAPDLARLSGSALSPRPMQRLAARLPVPAEPQIVIVEDGTGSGKTEAALLLAARMIGAGLGEGLFLAMPTMATANAMHGRLAGAMDGLFDGGASPILVHGKAKLAKELARREAASAQGGARYGESAAAWCDAWVADSRKTALFASAGAGTIDQAFLSILPKKHLTLRQYALAGRIVIVDEAHACDAYMGEELKTLVEMQARLGGSVIVLSATLTRKMRTDLVLAFARGRGLHPKEGRRLQETVRHDAYPLITRYTASGGVEEHPVTGDPELARSVGIARIDSRDAIVAAALGAARGGAAVAIICNAVDPAIETFEALLAQGSDPGRTHLFHARFTMGDRLAIERDVQAWFGRTSTEGMRRGRVLVATQVIEQSLDVDFDVMFSDIAPADLMVQRAGRLWRHRRPTRPVDAPVLKILAPDWTGVDSPGWLDATLGKAVHVYQMPGVLWRTARDLIGKGVLETPADVRRLVETAYDPDTGDLPEFLHEGHRHSVGEGHGKSSLARRNTISPALGYSELTAPSADENIGTRDGEPSVTLRLAVYGANGLEPYFGDGEAGPLAWALSEVAVRVGWLQRFSSEAPADPRLADATEALRMQWPEFEQTMPVLVVNPGGATSGESHSGLHYHFEFGLRGLDDNPM
jgi:CRISPR-associated endonuclease/helicase Cas3